ncbi:aminopeptidase P family protein [Candidatus Micrarchaeota archaeon]|nr:aminopeptidase P family protein [Candidatus Micrarchaeota archaeon]
MKESEQPILLYRGETFNPNFYYFSGMDVSNSFLLLEGGAKKLLVSKLEENAARAVMKKGIVVLDDFYPYLKKELKAKTVRIDGGRLPARIYERLAKFCRPKDASADFYAKRMVKTAGEIEKIRRACGMTKKILDSLELSKNMTENDVKKQLLMKTIGAGLEPAFEPIVAGGRNASVPHHACTGRRLGNFVLVDYGVKVENYCADLTRCFAIGSAAKELQLYEKLQGIFWKVADGIPDMEKSGEAGKLYEKLTKSAGLPAPIHSIGHGIGLDVHEFPRFGKKYADRMKGAAFTIEPGAYLRGYGARFEETVYFDGKKVRIL